MKKLMLCIAISMFVTAAFGQGISTQTTFYLVSKGDSVDTYLPVRLEVSGMNVTTRVDEPIFVEKEFPVEKISSVYEGDTLWVNNDSTTIKVGWLYIKQVWKKEFYAFEKKERMITGPSKIIDLTSSILFVLFLSIVFFVLILLVLRRMDDFLLQAMAMFLMSLLFSSLVAFSLYFKNANSVVMILFGVGPNLAAYLLALIVNKKTIFLKKKEKSELAEAE